MTDELDKINAEIQASDQAYKEIEGERRAAVEKAKAAVYADFEDRVRVAAERKRVALKAGREYTDANASHRWEGKRVFKIKRDYGRGYSSKFKEVRVEGIVEVRRTGTPMPGNVSWNLPRLGQPFVRLVKANGEPGLKIDRAGPDDKKGFINSEDRPPIWSLVEEGEDA